jgi:N-acetyl-anhydromuramyl-L-alanine amidase AmpD
VEIERERRSPNRKARPANTPITLCVLHASAGRSDTGDLSWICSPQSKVSYHYLVTRDGTIHELVDPREQAWHAGVSEWQGRKFCNAYSIGVAWANRHDGTEPLTAAQIAEAKAVIREWLKKYPTIEAIATHKDVAPGRKTDPELCPNFYRPDWTLDAIGGA